MAGLTDAKIRSSKPSDRPYKLFDEGGLYILVQPNGSRLWRLRYRLAGREKGISLGAYPAVSLARARAARDEARGTLIQGQDPSVERKLNRLAAAGDIATDDTFEVMARAWHAQTKALWTDRHAQDVIDSLELHVFPLIGSIRMVNIQPRMILGLLRAVWERPAVETAHRVRQRISSVFVHAIGQGVTDVDPAAMIKSALPPVVRGRQPSVTDLDEARAILAAVERTPAHPVTRLALRFLALTAVRPGMVCSALWSDFGALDPHDPVWLVPAERMKMKRDHIVPLARQTVEVLAVLRGMTGRCPYVFPNVRSAHRPMSENAMGYLLNRAGYYGRHVPHGWRATFSTVMNERFRQDRALIDLMLAHTSQDPVEAAYNRALHLQRRRELAQAWADLLLDDNPSTRSA